ncbi:unnamed protein product [Umbelopsis ramanniana]
MRGDLGHVDRLDFMKRLNDSALKATDYTALLSAYTRALMLGISERGFNININSDISVSVELRKEIQTPEIGDFLPLKAQRYPLFLTKDNAIPVAPLPPSQLGQTSKP